jgi:hypothetical protein
MDKQEIKEKLEFWDEKLKEAEKDKEIAELGINRAEIEIKYLTSKIEK